MGPRLSRSRVTLLGALGAVGLGMASALVLLSRSSSPEGLRCPDDRPRVAVGTAAFPPFTWLEEGTPRGFNVDFLEQVGRATGCTFRIELVEWHEAMVRVADGRADLLLGATELEERRATYAFTDRLLTLEARLFSRRDDFDVTDPGKLPAGTVIGVERDDVTAAFLRSHHAQLRFREYPDQGAALRGLASGEVAAVAADYYAARWSLRRQGLEDRIKAVGAPFMEGSYALAVRKEDTPLLAILNDGVGRLKRSGAAGRLEDEWFGEGIFDRRASARTVAVVAGSLGVVLLLLAAWNLALQAAVRRATASLRAREHQLRQAMKMEALGRLAGGVAHDFNNLLTVVLGAAQALRESLQEPLREDQAQDIGAIQEAAGRAAALTRQLLAFSRRSTLQPRVVELNAVVAETARLLERVLGEHVALAVRCAPDAGRVQADADQLSQVLLNVALNARDAMPDGGRIEVETRRVHLEAGRAWDRSAVAAGDYVELAVTDDGAGMDEETLQHLFEPFFTTKTVGKGTGLGLSVVYGIVSQSGGHVEVSSAPGKGTSFRIRLPRAREDTQPSPVRSAADGALPRGTETILVVEDADEVARLVRRNLESLGYRVRLASRPAEALRTIETDADVRLLLTDVVMPGMNGADLAARARVSRPGLRVLFMSGYSAGALPNGAPLLQKPFSPAQLARSVRETLDAG